MKKFEVGQEYRIVKVDGTGYGLLQEDQTLVVREVDNTGDAYMYLKDNPDAGDFSMLEEEIDEGVIVLIKDCDDAPEVYSIDYGRVELEVGQRYSVIDPDGFGYPRSLVQGDVLCITSSERDGTWLCHKADTGLTHETSDNYTIFLSDVNDGFVELKYTPPLPAEETSTPESQTSQYFSTVFEDEYNSLEEALVGETFYEYIEHLNCDDLVLKEKLIEMLTYEQRKIVVLYALALRKAG